MKIINRISLLGFIAWFIVMIVGLATEIWTRGLIFEDYLSASFGWMVLCAIVHKLTSRKREDDLMRPPNINCDLINEPTYHRVSPPSDA